MGFFFHTTCVQVARENVPTLTKMIEDGKQITRRTFLKHVDREDLRRVEEGLRYESHPSRGLIMAGDFHVAYFKSHWDNRPCVYFTWSAIEHVFTEA